MNPDSAPEQIGPENTDLFTLGNGVGGGESGKDMILQGHILVIAPVAIVTIIAIGD